jgi:hypothetical protein
MFNSTPSRLTKIAVSEEGESSVAPEATEGAGDEVTCLSQAACPSIS